MTHPDDVLVAYVDGELPTDEARDIEAAAKSDPILAGRIAAHRRVRERIGASHRSVLEEPVPASLLAAVSAAPARPSFTAWPTWTAMAACLVLGLAIGFGAPKGGLVTPGMTARGDLAMALDQQLAAEQDGGAIRIGVSFKDHDGGYCRTFQAKTGVAGLACRKDDAWHVPVLTAGASESSGPFRTASALPLEVAAAVEARMAGEPLDAAGEAKAQAAGWGR